MLRLLHNFKGIASVSTWVKLLQNGQKDTYFKLIVLTTSWLKQAPLSGPQQVGIFRGSKWLQLTSFCCFQNVFENIGGGTCPVAGLATIQPKHLIEREHTLAYTRWAIKLLQFLKGLWAGWFFLGARSGLLAIGCRPLHYTHNFYCISFGYAALHLKFLVNQVQRFNKT